MRKALLSLGAFGALACVASSASAFSPGFGIEASGKGIGEPTLDAIVKSGYSNNGNLVSPNVAGLDAGATFVSAVNGLFFSALGNTPASYHAHFSAAVANFGYYDPSNIANKTQLAQFTNNGVVSGNGNIVPSSFGLYIQATPPGGNTFYSQAGLNAGVEGNVNSLVNTTYNPYGGPVSSYQHIAVYKGSTVGTYFIGFEDLTGVENNLNGSDYGGGSDRDFNDVVVEVDNVKLDSPIPEPAFYQMGILLTGGGLMALRLRRKNSK